MVTPIAPRKQKSARSKNEASAKRRMPPPRRAGPMQNETAALSASTRTLPQASGTVRLARRSSPARTLARRSRAQCNRRARAPGSRRRSTWCFLLQSRSHGQPPKHGPRPSRSLPETPASPQPAGLPTLAPNLPRWRLATPTSPGTKPTQTTHTAKLNPERTHLHRQHPQKHRPFNLIPRKVPKTTPR